MKNTRLMRIMFFALLLTACSAIGKSNVVSDRESLIPVDAPKMVPENDFVPPELHSDEFEAPVPLLYPVNTRGAEDSAFVMPDGKTLYVWFTPNNRMDVIEQSQDTVTGIYKFEKQGEGWSAPERLWLVSPGTPHLDGCGFFFENKAWICGVRAEYEGIHWFTSGFKDGSWSNAKLADFDPAYEVGELHISNDGNELFFHSDRQGGLGGRDVWLSRKVEGKWETPENLKAVNSQYDEGWPALNPGEDELWISRNYGIWRSKKVDGKWTEAELIVSALAGEATIDQDGNVYFTHHYYERDQMIESDIYVIRRK